MSDLDFSKVLNVNRLKKGIESIKRANLSTKRLDGWFFIQEIRMKNLKQLMKNSKRYSKAQIQAELLDEVIRRIKLEIRTGKVFAGTEDDAFSRTYALINPDFKVETFEGYCDVTAVYDDITPNKKTGITRERIQKVRNFWAEHEYAKQLSNVYKCTGIETKEVVYFVEQVTGHTIFDFRPALENGLEYIIKKANQKKKLCRKNSEKAKFYDAVIKSLKAAVNLAERYSQSRFPVHATALNEVVAVLLEQCRLYPVVEP